MPVNCRICDREFQKLVTSTHLAYHNISSKDYKVQYGATSLSSPEYRLSRSIAVSGKNNPNFGKTLSITAKKKISDANTGKVPHNKGIACSATTKSAVSKANTGKVPHNKGKVASNDTKQKIKIARAKQIITPESVKKAIATKKKNGHNFAFFKGKTHTAASKKLIQLRSIATAKRKTTQSILDAAVRIAIDGYQIESYDTTHVTLSCSKNHLTTVTRQYLSTSKFRKEICTHCYPRLAGTSLAEKEIADFLAQYTTVITNSRQVISPKELDIYLPLLNIAVEYNGLYWHSDEFKHKEYHKEKMNECNKLGIKLIQIFEDEWINHAAIVKSRLRSYMGLNDIIYARKCKIVELTSVEANAFIKKTHLQGAGRSNRRYGLMHNAELVAVMTFLNSDISKNVTGWELNRFSTKADTNIVGGASKLFRHFISEVNPTTITTFADLRWSNLSTFYSAIGFIEHSVTSVNYWYIPQNEVRRLHRYSLKKPANSLLTERELREDQGYKRIYDCGNIKYIWHNL